MGFRGALVLAPTSFLLGVLVICLTVDYRLLWQPLTEQSVADGFQLYTTFYKSPPAIKAVLHGLMGLGIVSFLSKLHKWDDSAMFFDGSCLALFMFVISIYATVTIPALRTIVDPVVGIDTREDQTEAMRVLSAGNVMMIVLLGAVLVLQAGQEYTVRAEAKALAQFKAEALAKATAVPAEKKDQ